jgi:hypothetical protein
MAHNFKLTGDYYVSKEGVDTNDGLTPTTPLLTIQAALNKITTGVTRLIIVGTGVYREPISYTLSATNRKVRLYADGQCVIEGDGANSFVVVNSSNTGTEFTINGFELRNYLDIDISPRLNHNPTYNILNCTIKSPMWSNNLWSGTHTYLIENCVFINSISVGNITNNSMFMRKCILINSSVLSSTVNPILALNTYVDSQSFINGNGANGFNNIQGGLVVNSASAVTTGVIQDTVGNYYDLSLAGTGGAGTIGDPYWRDNTNGAGFFLAEHRIAYPTLNTRSFSADPLFNDAPNLNFTLQSNSPHIKAASDYVSNIGGTEYAVYIAATDDELDLDATVTDLTLAGGAYTITSPATEGSVISAPIFLQWPIVKPLTKIEYTGGLEFNKSITPPAAGNNNVPAYDTYTTGAGANPDRLSIRMRYSTQQTEPTLDAHWDNGGYWPAGEWRVFELNAKPKIDVNGIGNGSPTYIESSSLGDLTPSWIQTEIVLRDDYLP